LRDRYLLSFIRLPATSTLFPYTTLFRSTLEIVLGIDNLVFISIAVSRLPPEQRPRARRFGLALACVTRIMLLLSLAFLASMQNKDRKSTRLNSSHVKNSYAVFGLKKNNN